MGTLLARTRYHNMVDDRDREALDAYSAAVTTVVQRVLPSVASLRVRSRLGEGAGSASVLTDDGFMLTSAHVVEGASTVIAALRQWHRDDGRCGRPRCLLRSGRTARSR